MPLRTMGWTNRSGAARFEDPRRHEQLGRVGSLGLVEIREARGDEQVALLENRESARKPPRMIGQSPEPETNRTADRSRADPLHLSRGLRGRRYVSFAQRLHELAHEERRALRRAEERVDEDAIGRALEPRLHEPGDRRSRQGRKMDHVGGRIARHGREQPRVGAVLARARRHDERDVELLETRQEKRQEAERGGVGPVCVVDDEAQRRRGGEVRAQPVETVQDRERGIDARRRKAVDERRARQSQQAGRRAGIGLKEIRALVLVRLDEHRLEQLAHHAEGEVALELRSACREDAHPAVRGGAPRRAEQRRLADAGRPLDHDEGAAAAPRLRERRLDPRGLLPPLEKRFRGVGLRAGASRPFQDQSGRCAFPHSHGYALTTTARLPAIPARRRRRSPPARPRGRRPRR